MARSYIFNFSAKKITELGIKGTPVIILNYLYQFFKSKNAKTKTQNNKNYYWITYNKIVEDNQFLDIKAKRVKQIIDYLVEKKVLEKYKFEGHYTTLYLHIDTTKLLETSNDDMVHVLGTDDTLSSYMINQDNFYNEISYNNSMFFYESAGIDTRIIKEKQTTFSNILKSSLKLVLSQSVYKILAATLKIELENNALKLMFTGMSQSLMDVNIFKIERAIVSAYITLLISQNYTKTTHINTAKRRELKGKGNKSTNMRAYRKEELNSLFTSLEDLENIEI